MEQDARWMRWKERHELSESMSSKKPPIGISVYKFEPSPLVLFTSSGGGGGGLPTHNLFALPSITRGNSTGGPVKLAKLAQ